MKKIVVDICVCTECVMKGAMELEDSILELKKIKTELKINAPIQVQTDKCLGEGKHPELAPLVMVDGEPIENATSEAVMAKIMHIISEEQ